MVGPPVPLPNTLGVNPPNVNNADMFSQGLYYESFNKTIFCLFMYFLLSVWFSSCKKFLDKVPESQIIPEKYFNSDEDLGAYALGGYNFPGFYDWGFNNGDNFTDVYFFIRNGDNNPSMWYRSLKRVPSDYGSWTFDRIRGANYFFEQVLPKVSDQSLRGDLNKINHYIGEVHINRAMEYFSKLMSYGDYPIIKNTLSNTHNQALIDANKRMPGNEVARYILADLDTSIFSVVSMLNE